MKTETSQPLPAQHIKASCCLSGEGDRAITFVFEAESLKKGMAGRDADDIRLALLSERVRAENAQAYSQLISPLASYFDDILNVSGYHVNKPLLMSAEGKEAGNRRVTIHFPAEIVFEAEERVMRASLDEDMQHSRVAMRDSLAVFRSGHVFYLITLTCAGEGCTTLNEYQLIALQKLFTCSEHTGDLRRQIRLSMGDAAPVGLDSFINQRLRQLAESTGAEVNAVRDVLLPHVYRARPGEKVGLHVGWRDLRSVFIALESASLFELTAKGSFDERPEEMKALAGTVQGVIDFPEQDEGEVADSLVPLVGGETFVVYNRPGMLVEISHPWRSFERGIATIGTCPYLAMTNLCLAYNETILDELEEALDSLIYAEAKDDIHAAPLANLSDVVQKITRRRSSQTKLLQRNLQQRLAIFRNGILCRVPNLFRYETEREIFSRAEDERSIDLRFQNVLAVLDRYEQILEDIHTLGNYVAERRMNRILFVIALISLIALAKDVEAVANAFAKAWYWLSGLF